MSTIPASYDVRVLPGVLSAGGNAIDLNGMFLTSSTRIPTGTVANFPDPAAVAEYFGATSQEALRANTYFGGFDTSTQKPGAMLMAQYNALAVAAYLRGGNVAAALTLAALQALTPGTLGVVMDGYTHTATSINLSGATSFTAAAALIQAGLTASEPTEATFTGSISGSVLTVTVVAGGTLSVGQTITGAGVTAGSVITSLGTGTGLTGTYNLSVASTVSSESLTAVATAPTVSFDSISGAFVVTSGITGAPSTAAYATGDLSAALLLTLATGAVLSQGADAAVPAGFMNALTTITQNWACFTTIFNPDVSGNTVKLAFAAWTNAQGNRYAYVPWDADASPTASADAASSLGQEIIANTYSGIAPIWAPDADKAAFVLGFAASLDFGATNGRATLKFKKQSGLIAEVTDETTASNLNANGYNCYSAQATANQDFVYCREGLISGPFQWFDTYVNQIWINSQLQLALLVLLTTAKSVPYNAAGRALIEAACLDPISKALNFGAIRAGVTLSAQQIAIINNAAGKPVDQTVSQQGWFLQVLDASPQVRQARGTPPCNFWYTDGESVHRLTLNSIAVQ